MIEFRVLGSFEVVDGDRALGLGGPRQRALLAVLLVHRREPVSTERLIDALWGERAPASAIKIVQGYVSNLRKVLGDELLMTRGHGYVLQTESGQLDMDHFESLVADGRRALRNGDTRTAVARLRGALGLWRGPPLADFAYESFAQPEIARLEESRSTALEECVDAELALGEHARLVAELEALVHEHPLRERMSGQLMLALYRSGRQADALEVYQRARAHLTTELGLEPGTALRALQVAILEQAPSLQLAPDDRGHGVHGGIDRADVDMSAVMADRPRHPGVFADGDSRTSGNVRLPRSVEKLPHHNLPEQVSSFVGRERQLTDLWRLLAEARLVTLTGAGGVGKTRLALRVGAELLADSADGVWLVDLAPVGEAGLVAATAAKVLGVPEEAGRPALETLADALRERELVFVLDNCEHLIDDAAGLASVLLAKCRGVRVLATSREPLRIAGEHLYRVPSLTVPTIEMDYGLIARCEAVRLFVERVGEQQPGYSLPKDSATAVGAVCRRLDGIPLAIELAAARLRTLSVGELHTRLDRRFQVLTGGSRTALAHHQTLRALIDWSYELLSVSEQIVLQRLSVFAGGFELAAAEAICSAPDVDSESTIDLLASLVDKSLVQAEESAGAFRYRLLESVREYAASKLAERGEHELAAARTAHRDHFLALAEAAEPHLRSRQQIAWLEQLVAEQDNLRAALAHCLLDPNPEPGLRLATAMMWLWRLRGLLVEGADALTEQLNRQAAQEPTLTRGRALTAAAYLLRCLGDHSASAARAEDALTIARAHNDGHLIAEALWNIGAARLYRGESRTAPPCIDEALAIARELGDAHLTARCLLARGELLEPSPDAAPCYKEALQLGNEAGDRMLLMIASGNIGYLQLRLGELEPAHRNLDDALRIAHELDLPHDIVMALLNLGLGAYTRGDQVAAEQMFVEALGDARALGNMQQIAYALLALALTREGTDPVRSAELHGSADAVFNELGRAPEILEAGLRDASHARLRAELGDTRFETAHQAGYALSLDDAVELASRRARNSGSGIEATRP